MTAAQPIPYSAQPLTDILSRVAGAAFVAGNRVRLLRDGAENYPVWLDAIRGAARSVDLENYIIGDDVAGRQFATELAAAAARGVSVRVVYDWLGCRMRTPGRFWDKLRQAGVHVRAYNPPHPVRPMGWISRDHRKLLCVDGSIGFTGGLCIGWQWLGDAARGLDAWRDTAVEIRGPAVAQLEAAFADSWAFAGGEMREGAPPVDNAPIVSLKSVDAGPGLPLLVVQRRPDNMGLYGMEPFMAGIAVRSLWIADAYFVATTGYVDILRNAARNGVDVRLLVPGASDAPLVRSLSRASYRPLLQAGVRVFEWNGPMMHAKTVVADSMWSKVGSSNSNLASWITNRELDVVIRDPGFAAQMETMYLDDLTGATEIVLSSRRVARAHVQGGGSHNTPSGHAASNTANAAKAGRLVAGALGAGSSVGAALGRRRALEPAENPVLFWAGLAALALALVAIVWPRPVAWLVALAAGWIALVLLVRAGRMRHERKSSQDR